ncbi:hypothetical protein LEP1GSC161_0427 [Leptospira santarosai str. CBC1416]|uniref:Uncharacterized protein n=2 Tax=Leptospira santarosai TaxID=28183 RepID=A0A0E2BKK2_9LEPT|nr:hypothetical protein LEP1GSC179_4183 [Leptospira santarosai str. MOR084]EKR92494.1 hypothetical protein LEP1GSC163_2290 [Leptospira santarosai str. CBC379]EMO59391.1 hypothetical protein LEP1GSC161_0427 [Leptospira santarosai str. CBC1416]
MVTGGIGQFIDKTPATSTESFQKSKKNRLRSFDKLAIKRRTLPAEFPFFWGNSDFERI